MSILSALKAKGAKGKNIEEAIKTLPSGGGGDGTVFVANIFAVSADGSAYTATSDKTYAEVLTAYEAGKFVIFKVKRQVADYPYNEYCLPISTSLDGASNELDFSAYYVTNVKTNSVFNVYFRHDGTIIATF